MAAALAVERADAGERVLVVSVDPAHSLGDALGVRLGPEPTAVPGVRGLSALEVDAELERRRFLASHRGALLTLLDRGTYLDAQDAAELVELTVPGMDELAALFRLRELMSGGETIIVDTAPTGHTLRLLDLPDLANAWLQALQALESRSRAVSTALVGAYQPDEASALLDQLGRELTELSALLKDPDRTRCILVTGREPMILAETLRLQEELARRHIAVEAVVVNRSTPASARIHRDVPVFFVPPLSEPPVGVDFLRAFAALLHQDAQQQGAREVRGNAPLARSSLHLGSPFTPPLDRSLYFVAGKGGVGKTTTAAALAVRLSEAGKNVLLLGVDPAGSLGDVLGTAAEGAESLRLGERLVARQLDAHSTWEAFRAEYEQEAKRVFAALSPGPDHSGISRLVDLAPPGIDELSALVEVVDATEDRPYDAVVVDCAPSGHFLRLMELPRVALKWTHQAMRLLLKYREVVPPGGLGERLLRLARSLRVFEGRLRDVDRTWLLIVALPEPLSVAESGRLFTRLGELGIRPGALVVNRLFAPGTATAEIRNDHAAELCRLAGATPVFAAPALPEGPRGVHALSRLAAGWVGLNRVQD